MFFNKLEYAFKCLNLIYCRPKFNIIQGIFIEDISNIIKGVLEIFRSV